MSWEKMWKGKNFSLFVFLQDRISIVKIVDPYSANSVINSLSILSISKKLLIWGEMTFIHDFRWQDIFKKPRIRGLLRASLIEF